MSCEDPNRDPDRLASSRCRSLGTAACWRGIARLVLAGLMLIVADFPSSAQNAGDLEKAVKATYLYKFAPFIDWPDSRAEFPSGSFTICVVGGNPFGGMLDRVVQGQSVAGRPIAVQRFPSVSGNPGCSIMFVDGSDPQAVAGTLASVRGTSVLTVTDSQTDPAASGIISFELKNNHVRFAIDVGGAAANHLTISSKLLGLATRVTGRSKPQ